MQPRVRNEGELGYDDAETDPFGNRFAERLATANLHIINLHVRSGQRRFEYLRVVEPGSCTTMR